MHEVSFSLPLDNPVLIFAIILFIILFAPIILNKFRIPHLIGLILAGAVVGPNALNLLARDSSVVLFGTVGLLYIMFLAGLEIDLADFKKNSGKSIYFGMLTFLIPMFLGTAAGYYHLNMSLPASVLLASMFASHTLVAYPIISGFGIAKNRAVNIAVGGTVITDTLALMVLAVIVGMSSGDITGEFWVRLIISLSAASAVIVFVFPIIGRWFIKNYDNHVSQYVFVLGLVFLASFLVELAGVEAIIGAFLAGLALNRLIPGPSPLMNRIEFVGNALFIPFFLIGVGMLIDYRAFFTDLDTINVAITMSIIASVSKYFAAWITQKSYGFSNDERRLIFGLSNAQAAATLAAVLVGYEVIIGQTPDGEDIRLLDESILNGTIMMILVTCTIASFSAQKGAENIALSENTDRSNKQTGQENILIPVGHTETVEELVHLSLNIRSKSVNGNVYALNIIDSESKDEKREKKAHEMLSKARATAYSVNVYLKQLVRYDLNLVNGVTGVVKQFGVTDIILGLHHRKGITDSFLGSLTEGILKKCNSTVFVYKPTQPLSTIKKTMVVVPPNAHKELGFPFWVSRVWNIAKSTGSKMVFYATNETLDILKKVSDQHPISCDFSVFENWSDFLILARDLTIDDNFIVIMSRKHHISYNRQMKKIPSYLNEYFKTNNFILLYPMQLGVACTDCMDLTNPEVVEPLVENFTRLDETGQSIVKILGTPTYQPQSKA